MAAILEELETKRRWVLKPGIDNVIGRVANLEIHVYDMAVTRRHALLRHDGSAWHVLDLGCSNGTWWSRGGPFERVAQQPLSSGDRIRIGATMMTFLEGVDASEDVTVEMRSTELRERLAAGDSPDRARWLVEELDRLGADLVPVVDAARAAQRSASPASRRMAAAIFGALCRSARLSPHPLEEALSLCRDPDPSVRSWAVWHVATAMNDPTAPLLSALEDPDEQVFDTTAKALAIFALAGAPSWTVTPEHLEALGKRAPARRRERIVEIASFYRKAARKLEADRG
jgi:predicted component of type VI protein secretion system